MKPLYECACVKKEDKLCGMFLSSKTPTIREFAPWQYYDIEVAKQLIEKDKVCFLRTTKDGDIICDFNDEELSLPQYKLRKKNYLLALQVNHFKRDISFHKEHFDKVHMDYKYVACSVWKITSFVISVVCYTPIISEFIDSMIMTKQISTLSVRTDSKSIAIFSLNSNQFMDFCTGTSNFKLLFSTEPLEHRLNNSYKSIFEEPDIATGGILKLAKDTTYDNLNNDDSVTSVDNILKYCKIYGITEEEFYKTEADRLCVVLGCSKRVLKDVIVKLL